MVNNYSIKGILEELFSKIRANIKPGLERTISLLDFLENPHHKFKSIHIAGTNGKGSVSSILASILQENGLKTGLYVSPHLFKFNERVSVNGSFITDEDIVDFYNKTKQHSEKIGATFFELTTALAFHHFANNNVDIAIIETGLGGRLDSTNILKPVATCITSIGMDHSDFLGKTIEKIASEKAGIIKDNTPIYIPDKINPKALPVILNKSNETNSSLKIIVNKFNCRFNSDLTSSIEINNTAFKIPIPGKKQLSNFLLAYSISKDIFKVSNQNIQKGLDKLFFNTSYFGRVTVINSDPLILVDVSHNLEAIKNLIDTFELHYPDQKFNLLFTLMDDKDYKSILKEFKNIEGEIIITRSSSNRNFDPKILSNSCIDLNLKHTIIEDPELAFDELRSTNKNFIITGSFYLICDLKNKLSSFKINKNLL